MVTIPALMMVTKPALMMVTKPAMMMVTKPAMMMVTKPAMMVTKPAFMMMTKPAMMMVTKPACAHHVFGACVLHTWLAGVAWCGIRAWKGLVADQQHTPAVQYHVVGHYGSPPTHTTLRRTTPLQVWRHDEHRQPHGEHVQGR